MVFIVAGIRYYSFQDTMRCWILVKPESSGVATIAALNWIQIDIGHGTEDSFLIQRGLAAETGFTSVL